MARVRDGDRDAYAELVHRHAAAAHRTAVLLGAGADADDVVQDALVKAYRALGRFRDGAAFRPWLLRIVANETRNLHRSARRRTGRESVVGVLAEGADPASAALSTERRAELVAALRRLSEPYRLVVTCRYLLDLDEADTAVVLGWPRGTVKSRLHRALRQLQQLVDQPDVRQEVRRG
ncbi:MAG: RNA polymerase sigma factor [Micromonosporaceae bacterium]